MKLKYLLILSVITVLLTSCSSIKVTSDYDSNTDFNKYKTFAFYKTGIDKAQISSLDKKRILRALEFELKAKGYTKSQNPDFLISIFTKSRQKVNVRQNNFGYSYGFGWGWNPWIWNGANNNVSISKKTEGTLFVDFIDKEKKELMWQGIGTGALKIQNKEKKEARIKEFVKEIIARFPPGKEK